MSEQVQGQAVLKDSPYAFLTYRALDANSMLLQSAAGKQVIDVARVAARCLKDHGTVWVCGNGGSAEQANHFAAELVGRYQKEREPYRAFSLASNTATLTAIANDYGWENVFSRQVLLGRPGDVLIALSTSGRSPNILKALRIAQQHGLTTVGLGPRDHAAPMYELCEHKLRAWEHGTPATQENHLVILHHLAALIEHMMGETWQE